MSLAALTPIGAAPSGVFLGLALIAVGAEAIAAVRLGRRVHDRGETVATLLVQAGHLFVRPLEVIAVGVFFGFVWSHRLATIDATTPLGLLGLFVAFD